MPTFMMSMNFTDQGIRGIKDAPKRAEAARDLAKKLGVEVKHLYLTSGDSDLVVFVETPNGDNVAKFALALGSLGNVRTSLPQRKMSANDPKWTSADLQGCPFKQAS